MPARRTYSATVRRRIPDNEAAERKPEAKAEESKAKPTSRSALQVEIDAALAPFDEIEASPSEFIIKGKPLLLFRFNLLLSANDYLAVLAHNRFAGGSLTDKWKGIGRALIIKLADEFGLETFQKQFFRKRTKKNPNPRPYYLEALREHFIRERCAIIVRVWRKDARTYDVPNIYIKPLLDGFTQAGLWRDDDSSILRRCLYQYEGIDKKNPRFEVLILELEESNDKLF